MRSLQVGRQRRRFGFALAVILVSCASLPANAAERARLVDDRPFQVLDTPLAVGTLVSLEPISLDDGTRIVLEVSRIEPFTKDAQIVVHGRDGDSLAPLPSDRWFTGRVEGDSESFVMLARGRSLRGFIATGGRVATIGSAENVYGPGAQGPTVIDSFDPLTDAPPEMRWFTCGTEALPTPARALAAAPADRRALTSVMYFAGIAIETDNELYVKKGSSSIALAQYVGDLFASISAIYQRDLLVTLQVNYLSIWTTASDPWSTTDSESALYEFGDYWHANRGGIPRTTAHLLSGRNLGGGIAWIGTICGGDFSTGSHFGGGYGLTGNLSGTAPANLTTTYWDFYAVSHEIGHNFGSPHTHCYSPPVDMCYSGETGCYSGPTSVPAVKGTIMSYCHLLPGGYGNVKMFFGVAGEPSQAVTTLMRGSYIEHASCLGTMAGPVVSSIFPASGPTSGGTSVTISGSGFTAPATVKIGGTAATSIVAVNATTITAHTPARAAGAADVSVVVSGNQGMTLAGGFTYTGTVAPPPAPRTTFHTLSPCRVLDTRNANGALAGPALAPNAARVFVVKGTCGIPAAAGSISVNLTVIPAAAGRIVVYPGNGTDPGTSSVSFNSGQVRANNAILLLSTDGTGSIGVLNGSTGANQFVVDVTGYFQ
jgi:hypothetical protein